MSTAEDLVNPRSIIFEHPGVELAKEIREGIRGLRNDVKPTVIVHVQDCVDPRVQKVDASAQPGVTSVIGVRDAAKDGIITEVPGELIEPCERRSTEALVMFSLMSFYSAARFAQSD